MPFGGFKQSGIGRELGYGSVMLVFVFVCVFFFCFCFFLFLVGRLVALRFVFYVSSVRFVRFFLRVHLSSLFFSSFLLFPCILIPTLAGYSLSVFFSLQIADY